MGQRGEVLSRLIVFIVKIASRRVEFVGGVVGARVATVAICACELVWSRQSEACGSGCIEALGLLQMRLICDIRSAGHGQL